MVEAVFVLGMLVILGCWLKVLLELYGLKPPRGGADRRYIPKGEGHVSLELRVEAS